METAGEMGRDKDEAWTWTPLRDNQLKHHNEEGRYSHGDSKQHEAELQNMVSPLM